MKCTLVVLTAFFVSFAVCGAFANDAVFRGAGADLVPLSEGRVRMQSEDIVLSATGFDWQVRAHYVFSNLTQKKLKLQVGFPEYRCLAGDDTCENTAFRQLETRVDKKPVEHRQGKLDKSHDWAEFLGVVWLFDVEFEPKAEVVVEHRYTLSAGGDIYGNLFTTYVTRTGQAWAGSIEKARFTAIFPPFTRAIKKPKVPGLRVGAPRLILAGTPRVQLVLEGKNWTPTENIPLVYNASASMSFAEIKPGKLRWGDLFQSGGCNEGSDPEGAQRCLNELYASKGYPFRKEAQQKLYYGKDPNFLLASFEGHGDYWLRNPSPLEAFSTDWFNAAEASSIRKWSAQAETSLPTPKAVAKPEAETTPFSEPPAAKPMPGASAVLGPEPSGIEGSGTRTEPLTSSRCGCRLLGAKNQGSRASLVLAAALGLSCFYWRRVSSRRRSGSS